MDSDNALRLRKAQDVIQAERAQRAVLQHKLKMAQTELTRARWIIVILQRQRNKEDANGQRSRSETAALGEGT
jgi:hypothetical protein